MWTLFGVWRDRNGRFKKLVHIFESGDPLGMCFVCRNSSVSSPPFASNHFFGWSKVMVASNIERLFWCSIQFLATSIMLICHSMLLGCLETGLDRLTRRWSSWGVSAAFLVTQSGGSGLGVTLEIVTVGCKGWPTGRTTNLQRNWVWYLLLYSFSSRPPAPSWF